ncbi:MAG: hypothetical protein GXY00_03110 [Bacteroidales bacterium]|nr:hypothetical protein [Bacteroidales bacterium]HPI36072.1 VTT domain-containing protein [Prolixibacteraceae bacterium]
MSSSKYPRLRFFLVNLLKGLVWLSLITGAYILFMELVYKDNPEYWIEKFYSKPGQIYGLYFFSEFCFGLFPPELFLVWAFHKGSLLMYGMNVLFFALVSMAAGVTTYFLGKYLNRVLYFRYFQRKFFVKLMPLVRKWGLFLIVVAAATPLPWSGTCLVVGASGYPLKGFLLAALTRLARFAIHGYIIFQTHQF